ncbi:MAG: TonB-dependent receptor [Candidatus Delongbacteria bacterium]|nr:TonB-dependent receptor [Candidatus Delongbacteria bacterium]
MRKVLSIILLLIGCYSALWAAGTAGKIAGRVVDAESGEPLPSVNVILDAIWMDDIEVDMAIKQGAASDANGYFTILNVSPGEYTIKFSMIGYAEYIVKKVKVQIDLTTQLNANMKPQAVMGEEVVIVAQRAAVVKDISNSQMNVESKVIKNLPVQNVNNVVSLQAGILIGSQGVEIRGGAAKETAFMIDGLSLNDERSNIPYSAVSLSSVQEIQIQTGGFNAEYGNVRSGLVNVVTKEGDVARYSGTVNLQYTPPQDKHFGISLYDPMSYFNRPYMDPQVCWTGTNNGAWDANTRNQYVTFGGWNQIAANTLIDNDPNNDLTPEGAKRLYEWQHRRQGDIEDPDYVIDAGFGGPLPIFSNKLGKMRFYISHFREKEMYIYPLSRDAYSNNHTQIKITSDLNSNMKLVFSGLYGETYGVCPYQWTTTPTGRVLSDNSEVADILSSSEGLSVLYVPGYYSPSAIYRNMMGLKFTHMMSQTTFYEVSLQNNINRYRTTQTSVRDTSKVNEIIPGYYVDEAPYGYWGYSTSAIEGMRTGGWMNLGRDHSDITTFKASVDLTSQVGQRNQIKTGLNLTLNNYDIHSFTETWAASSWCRSQIYDVTPYRIGAYVQDKLEFEGFIANVGLRLDYSDANSDVYIFDTYDKNLGSGYGNSLETTVKTENSEAQWALSPRLGVSHPISINSKLYFNYGHFYAEPESNFRFRIQRESNGQVTSIGNPNSKMEKTVAYELGYAHNVMNMFLVNIAAYYKDVSNQANWITYININSSINYSQIDNNNYADIRGLELTVTKRLGKWISGFVNYTYDVKSSGYFDLQYYYEDPNKQRNWLINNPPYQDKPRARPYARASIDLHTPEKIGPNWNGFYPLGEWNMNILANWRAGSYTTYNPNNLPYVVNNVQWRDNFTMDMRLSKVIRISKKDIQFYLDITNVFNLKYLNYAGFADSYDYQDYLASLRFSWEEGDQKGNDRVGDYRPVSVAYDPLESNPNNDPDIAARNQKRIDDKAYINMPNITSVTFLNPRQFTFGFRFNF